MKKSIFLISGILLIIFVATLDMAAARVASVEWGEELYSSPALGGSTNEKSCTSCHDIKDKKMLKKILDMSKKERNAMINQCITGPLQGKALDPKSEEMRALRLYLNHLTNDCY